MTVTGTLQEDLRNLKTNEFSFIDINSQKPLVVIGNQIFSGEFQVAVLQHLSFSVYILSHNLSSILPTPTAETFPQF